MQLYRLLDDVTAMPEGTSRRQKQLRLTELINERYPGDAPLTLKRVEKWFERGSIPSAWLMRIVSLPKKPLNLGGYA